MLMTLAFGNHDGSGMKSPRGLSWVWSVIGTTLRRRGSLGWVRVSDWPRTATGG